MKKTVNIVKGAAERLEAKGSTGARGTNRKARLEVGQHQWR